MENFDLSISLIQWSKELEAEAKWEAAFAGSQNLLADLAAEAIAEYKIGQTQVLALKTL